MKIEEVEEDEVLNTEEAKKPPREYERGEIHDIYNDGGILKEILEIGNGERPPPLSRVYMNIKGYVDDPSSPFISLPVEEYDFTVGHGAMATGIEMTIVTMRVGEKAFIDIQEPQKYGYNDNNRPDGISPNSTLKFEIKLIRFEKEEDIKKMKPAALIEYGCKKRILGNEMYGKGALISAITQYEKAVSILLPLFGRSKGKYPKGMTKENISEEELEAYDKIPSQLVLCYCNIAACKLKTNEYNDVVTECTRAIEIDNESVKAFLRRAKAYRFIYEFELAKNDLIQAKKLLVKSKNSDSKVVSELLISVEKTLSIVIEEKKKAMAKEKRQFAGFFDKVELYNDLNEKEKKKSDISSNSFRVLWDKIVSFMCCKKRKKQ